ncbi:MAG: Fe-S-binding domain-containing protein, partial [Bacteroidetes bacterium]
VNTVKPKETFTDVMKGLEPRLYMDIHDISEVNKPEVSLSLLDRPAHSTDFGKK